MKNITVLILTTTLLCCVKGFSQKSYIGFFIGAETSNLREFIEVERNFPDFRYLEKGFNKNSYLIGIRIDQNISEYLNLTLKSSFGNKKITDTDSGSILPLSRIEYHHIYNSFLINPKYKKTNIGVGIGYNLFFKMKYNDILYDDFITENEWAGLLNFSQSFRQFSIDLTYSFGLENYFIAFTEPAKSFRLTLGYNLELITWGKRRNKVKCPTI